MQQTINWPPHERAEEWIEKQPLEKWRDSFEKNGVLKIDCVLEPALVEAYKDFYEKIKDGSIDATLHRWDLGSHEPLNTAAKENVPQIMWPSYYVPELLDGPLHHRLKLVSRALLRCDDVEFDFEFFMWKPPQTNVETPWHQDEAYWMPNMPDKRAVSAWTPMDETTVENGCMWFVEGSHIDGSGVRAHERIGHHHVMRTTDDVSENDATPYPLQPGGCTLHSGRILHYSRGNATDTQRRGYVLGYRPQPIIELQRKHGYDHGFEKGVHILLDDLKRKYEDKLSQKP